MAVLDEIEFPWKAIELLSPGWIEWKPILETTSWDLNNDRKLFLWFQCEGCLSICTCVPAVCDVWPHTYRDVNVHDRLSYFYFPNRKDIGREIARRRRWGVVRPILRVYVQQQLREEGKERKEEGKREKEEKVVVVFGNDDDDQQDEIGQSGGKSRPGGCISTTRLPSRPRAQPKNLPSFSLSPLSFS